MTTINSKELGNEFQSVTSNHIIENEKKGKRGGPFAHLVFKTREGAVAAVQQRNNFEVETDEVDDDGNKFVLVVEEARPRAPRTGGRRNRRPRNDAGYDDDDAA